MIEGYVPVKHDEPCWLCTEETEKAAWVALLHAYKSLKSREHAEGFGWRVVKVREVEE